MEENGIFAVSTPLLMGCMLLAHFLALGVCRVIRPRSYFPEALGLILLLVTAVVWQFGSVERFYLLWGSVYYSVMVLLKRREVIDSGG